METRNIIFVVGDNYYIPDSRECTMNFGGQKRTTPKSEYADYEEVKDDEKKEEHTVEKTTQEPTTELSRLERVNQGIKLVHDSGVVKNDYEYVAVQYIILEKKILPILSFADHERLLDDTGLFDQESLPKANNMKAYIVKGKFPDWVVDGKKYDVTRQFVAVARKFLEGYGK